MGWQFSGSTPVHEQIRQTVCFRILSGKYAPGMRLPSVRELALEAAVNPNTMQRALSELEESGLVYTESTVGRFVTADASVLAAARESAAESLVLEFLARADRLGLTESEVTQAFLRLKAEKPSDES